MSRQIRRPTKNICVATINLWLVGLVFALVTFSSPPKLKANAPTLTQIVTPNGIVAQDFRGFDMVYVPGGSFEMGITHDALYDICFKILKDGDQNHCTQLVETIGKNTGIFQTHTVLLQSFWIDRYEVTIEQYQLCVGSGPGRTCQSIDLSYAPKLIDDIHKPQVGVNWYDAEYFCNTRGARLPTEAEWEYTARGSSGFIFPWGNSFSEGYVSPANSTYPVGKIPENKSWIGVYDLPGNAAEWVEDRFAPYVATQNWPQGFPANDVSRVVRGGSWANRSFQLTAFDRESMRPEAQDQTVGFRCARTIDPRK